MTTIAWAASTRQSPPFRRALIGAALLLSTAAAVPAPVLCKGTWEEAADAAASPPSRSWPQMAYDEQRERVVLFGGGLVLGDTWEWDGSAWSQVADSGPAPRDDAALAYDNDRQRVVLFGGQGLNYVDTNDTWEWDGVAWQEVADPNKAPPVRHGHGIAYDSQRHKMVLFGGFANFDHLLGDTWTRAGTDWTRRHEAGGPAPEMIHRAIAFDREREVTVMFVTSCPRHVLSTWTWDGVSWTESAGAVPGARYAPALAYDSARHRVVLYGGDRCPGEPPGYPIDTWEWDGSDWQQVSTGGGPGRHSYGPSMAYDRARGRSVLFGGSAGSDSTWAWDGPTYRCDTPIPGDINCDGVVDVDDRKIVDAAHGKKACAADDTRDLDGDGRITTADEKMLVSLCTFANCARHD
jgi:hypothetical protein